MPVPRPEPARGVEDEALSFLLAEPDPAAPPPRAAGTSPPDEQLPRPAPKPAVTPAPPRKPVAPPRPSRVESPRPPRAPRRDESGRRRFSIAVHPSIILGVLMMLGAVAWFVVGLAAGWVYFYPPILFVLGVLAVIRGFRGQE